MDELVEVIVKALVSKPEEVKITKRTDDKGEIIDLNVAKEDMGRVIGKGGRIAKSIRSVIKAAAIKENKKVLLNIID